MKIKKKVYFSFLLNGIGEWSELFAAASLKSFTLQITRLLVICFQPVKLNFILLNSIPFSFVFELNKFVLFLLLCLLSSGAITHFFPNQLNHNKRKIHEFIFSFIVLSLIVKEMEDN